MATKIQQSRRKRPSEKAVYHAVTGAGRRRVVRDFFGLTPADEQAIEKDLDVSLAVNLQREGIRSS